MGAIARKREIQIKNIQVKPRATVEKIKSHVDACNWRVNDQ